MKALLIRFLRHLLRWLEPSVFFNEDASRQIDSLTVEIERLRNEKAGNSDE